MKKIELNWLENATRSGGSFVSTFARACYCADAENFKILQPVLDQMIVKYPRYAEPPVEKAGD